MRQNGCSQRIAAAFIGKPKILLNELQVVNHQRGVPLSINCLLLEAERLLRDVSFVADLFPANDAVVLLHDLAAIFISLEDEK